MVLMLLFAITTWQHGKVWSVNKMQAVIRHAIESIEVDYQLSDVNGVPVQKKLRLYNASSPDEVWTYMEKGLLPLVAGTKEDPAIVRSFNHLVGEGILMRQLRVSGRDCPVAEGLRKFYRSQCRSNNPASADFGPEAPEVIANLTANNMTKNKTDWSFKAGGGFAVATLPFGPDPKTLFYALLSARHIHNFSSRLIGGYDVAGIKGTDRINELRHHRWCDAGTDFMEARFTLFNPEAMMFTQVTITVTIVKGGMIKPSLEVRPLSSTIYRGTLHIVVDVFWVLFLVMLFFGSLQEVSDRKSETCGGRCCGDVWLLLDWLNLLVGFFLILFFIAYATGVAGLDPQMADLGLALSQTAVEQPKRIAPYLMDAYQEQVNSEEHNALGRLAQLHEDLDLIIYVKIYHRLGMFWYVSILLLRFFRGFAGQPRLVGIGKTLSKGGSDIAHLALTSIIVFMNLSLGGNILFGYVLDEWSTYLKASTTAMTVLFGQADLASMYAYAPISTMIWAFIYVVSMVVMMTNMLVAILVDHHIELRDNMGRARQTLPHQLVTTIQDTWWKRSYSFRIIIRFAKSKVKQGGRLDYILPDFKPEPKRIAVIPYDDLIEAFMMDEHGGMPPADGSKIDPNEHRAPPPWSVVTPADLYAQGIDASTTKYLMDKCRSCTEKASTEELPVAQLFEEFEAAMNFSYNEIETLADTMGAWIGERKMDALAMEPQQKKLEKLSRMIIPSEPLMALDMPMLEGPAFGDMDTPAMMLDNAGVSNNAISDAEPPPTTTVPSSKPKIRGRLLANNFE
eukprot:TRINITY_DN4253_c2_g1_i1.p1 TRINITY_DN4253_c2_g1~~TRINITY_DN4253_c2_g1_i1.p1  ORF type:complete len:865 (-),score=151.26 TRINITY_DN4253_c2_g1_i1:368-2740(-)